MVETITPDMIQIVTPGEHLDVQEISGESILTFSLRLGGYTLKEMFDLDTPLPPPREVELDITYTSGKRAHYRFRQDGFSRQDDTTADGRRVLRLTGHQIALTAD
jgi:hypothetical protein